MTKSFLAIAVLLMAAMDPVSGRTAPPPQVLVTIKPVHSLVAMVMDGVNEPKLLIDSGASPHTYSLKPSDARALQQADVVFWVGEGLETFLQKPLQTLPKDARVVEVAEAPGVTLLAYRGSGQWESHVHGSAGTDAPPKDHADQGHAHDEAPGYADMHMWLDPTNARAIVQAAAVALCQVDPGRADLYRSNAERAVARLQVLDDDLRQTLSTLAGRPYVVFHDAYQYLERRYRLSPIGSITVNPDRQPSAQRIAAIREKITKGGAVCVFSEPQFQPKLVQILTEGTTARIGVLDADGGVDVPPGPDAYPTIMRNLSDALRACLDPSS